MGTEVINLLPIGYKQEIIFARRNRIILRWIFGSLIGLLGVIFFAVAGQFFLRQSINSYNDLIHTQSEELKKNNQKETLDQVKSIQNNFMLVVDVLSKEVLFSKLIPRVGQVMPQGTLLESMNINAQDDTLSFDISARATDFTPGSQIQVNLTDPANKLFVKADLVNIDCTDDNEKYPNHPCKVKMRVLPAESNEFLFLEKKANK